MGILDKKTRFIDLVVTQEGKRQMASGKLRAEFASLSDCNTFYSKGDHEDVSERLFFEVMERPENMIIMEKDDSGKLISIDFSATGSIVGNNMFVGNVESDVIKLKALTGSQFSSVESEVLKSSLKHFKNNFFIGDYDRFKRNDFEVTNENIVFTITDKQPFGNSPYIENLNVNNAEPFFLDSRLSHLPNFKFLPPVNEDGSPYGIYTNLKSGKQETWEDIKERIGPANFADSLPDTSSKNLRQSTLNKKSRKLLINNKLPVIPEKPKEKKEILFSKTSSDNNLLIQIFEDGDKSLMTKLDIIDAGYFTVNNDINNRLEKRVFYAGKIYYDDFNTPTFVNIFTIIID